MLAFISVAFFFQEKREVCVYNFISWAHWWLCFAALGVSTKWNVRDWSLKHYPFGFSTKLMGTHFHVAQNQMQCMYRTPICAFGGWISAIPTCNFITFRLHMEIISSLLSFAPKQWHLALYLSKVLTLMEKFKVQTRDCDIILKDRYVQRIKTWPVILWTLPV